MTTKGVAHLRNLGPKTQRDLHEAGIDRYDQIKELGPEATLLAVMTARRESGRSTKEITSVYLYALYGAIHDVDWRDVPVEKKLQFQAFLKEIRESGQFD